MMKLTELQADLLNYLSGMKYLCEMRQFQYAPTEVLVLDAGEFFPMHPESRITAPPRQCFKNAFVYCANHPGHTYCEGFALSEIGFPVLHAWAVDAERKVIDPTWGEKGWAYCGIPFSWRYVVRECVRTGTHSMLDSPGGGWPLQRGKVEIALVRAWPKGES